MSVTPPSSWPWVDHPVSGLRPATKSPLSDSLSLRLPYSVKLATERKSLTHYTKGTQSPLHKEPSGFFCLPKDLVHPYGSFESRCALLERSPKTLCAGAPTVMYACGFRIYFTPLPGFFSPFPHGTGSLSVDYEYLALEDGPPMFRQGFTCPALLVVRLVPLPGFNLRGYHPLWPAFPDRSANAVVKSYRLLPFRSPLLWESRLISFPPAT